MDAETRRLQDMAAKCRRLAPMFEPATAQSLLQLAGEYDRQAARNPGADAHAEPDRLRYFLHLHACGTITADRHGCDCRDLAEARQAGAIKARRVMAEEIAEGRLCLNCCIVIEDAAQHELDRVWFRDAITVSGEECV